QVFNSNVSLLHPAAFIYGTSVVIAASFVQLTFGQALPAFRGIAVQYQVVVRVKIRDAQADIGDTKKRPELMLDGGKSLFPHNRILLQKVILYRREHFLLRNINKSQHDETLEF